MRVLMLPHLRSFRSEESGIKRVVEAYFHYLPKFDVDLVSQENQADLVAVHAGNHLDCDVAHNHGLYWTADYPAVAWEWSVNANVVENLRRAAQITVPSSWVAETITRDMRRRPHVIGHGIDWDLWQHKEPVGDYVLWNKNRRSDVCDPTPVMQLALKFPKQHFVSTFAVPPKPGNVNEIGLVIHDQMKKLVQRSQVYLSTVKETFGIGILEAMASGVPVLGYAYGGILDLVKHGVNGYLARPGDIDDLAQGLAYCIKHRATLGANGREMARAWTWEAVVEKVAGVYRLAMGSEEPDRPVVTVVIPSYNYGERVGRAIESVQAQDLEGWELFVVDDGSQDDGATARVVAGYAEQDPRVQYIRQENQGVANARNNGAAAGSGRYICCLDADDALDAGFLSTCVAALDGDRSLGVAYTALRYILPNGQTGVSSWPPEWDFDAQLKRRNQVPTCCMYRRDMWASLGGYRQRYAPRGAGSEDAEFWTRCGAYGWKAAKVTDKPLFIYSQGSGRVSGDPEYQEVDWLAWHPWAKDGLHPFASYARPRRWSHPVRQYDEPVISVVIPVAPGHEKNVINALDSLDAQTFRRWEVVVVWDTGDATTAPETAFPHVRWVWTGGKIGAGAARNLGAKASRAPFLLFLDADDWLYPEAMDQMIQAWEDTEACIYTDYVGKAFIDDPKKLAADLRERILWRDEKDGQTVIRYNAAEYDWQKAQRQPEGERPWIWCNITTLLPRAWFREAGGFDEAMESWEDVDLWYRIARAGHPFVRIPEPLLVYQFYTGQRRDRGVGMHAELVDYLREKYKEVPTVGCTSCGGRKVAPPVRSVAAPTVTRAMVPQSELLDADMRWCIYKHPNRGNHPVVGNPILEQRIDGLHMIQDANTRLWRIHYGYRAGGDRFLVHKKDIELAGHLFQQVVERKVPQIKRAPIAPPEPVEGVELPPEPERPVVLATGAPDITASDNGQPDPLDLQRLPGITADIEKQLKASGINSREQLLALGVKGLQQYKGVGPVKAERILGVLGAE